MRRLLITAALLLSPLNASAQTPPSITISDLSQSEGTGTATSFIVTLTLSQAVSETVTVNYSTGGFTADASDGDFTAIAGSTATFTPGTTTTTVTVVVNADTKFEADEYFFVNLTAPQSATIADPQARLDILNDDAQPTISVNDIARNEGTLSLLFPPLIPFTFTVSLSNPSFQAISVNWATADGTATGDYIPDAQSVTIPAGQISRTFFVNVIADPGPEPDETFFVNLSAPVNATISDPQGQATIVNDDGVPVVNIASVSQPEGNTGTSPFVFDVTLSGSSASTITVTWATASDTAFSPSDYLSGAGTVTFAPGDVSETITVAVVGDLVPEPDEQFRVHLVTPIGATIGVNSSAAGLIVNDDGSADLSIAKTGPSVALPGSQLTYTIVVSNAGPQSAANVVVTDTIPAGTTFVSATPSQGTCSGTSTVTCSLGIIANGGTASIALTVVTPSTPQTISNTATVANTPEPDPSPGNNTSPAAATVVAAAPSSAAGIPTVSEWGLLALLAALIAAAVLKLR